MTYDTSSLLTDYLELKSAQLLVIKTIYKFFLSDIQNSLNVFDEMLKIIMCCGKH